MHFINVVPCPLSNFLIPSKPLENGRFLIAAKYLPWKYIAPLIALEVIRSGIAVD